jgi:hypothetical protein
MALIFPMALSLMVGGTDFGLALATEATGGKLVRDAARYLATLPAAAICGTGWGLTAAKNLAVYGNTGGTGSPLISGMSTSNITITPNPSDCSGTFTVTVTATYTYNSLILASFAPVAATFAMTSQHVEPQIGQLGQ